MSTTSEQKKAFISSRLSTSIGTPYNSGEVVESFLLINNVDFLLLNGAGDRLLL